MHAKIRNTYLPKVAGKWQSPKGGALCYSYFINAPKNLELNYVSWHKGTKNPQEKCLYIIRSKMCSYCDFQEGTRRSQILYAPVATLLSFCQHFVALFFFFFCPRVNGAYGCAGYFAVPTCLGTKKWQLNNKLRSPKRLRFVLKSKLCLGPKQLLPVFVIGSKTLEWSKSSLLSTRLMAKHFQLLSKVP